jgi:hypothetical protein
MAQEPSAVLLNTHGEGVQIDQDEVESLVINTENSAYEMTVLHGQTDDVLLRGGRHFPEKTRMKLLGASVGGSLLKVHTICVGLSMELLHNGRRIVTSPVCSIGVTWKPGYCETKRSAIPRARAS